MPSEPDKSTSSDPQIAKLSLSTLIFFMACFIFGGTYVLAYTSIYSLAIVSLIAAIACGTLGLIQLMNAAAIFFPKAFARGIHWIHAMVFECFAFLGIGLSRLIRVVYSSKASPTAAGRPILLIHGYLNDSSVWLFQTRQLQKAGLGPIYTINLGNPFASIRKHAEKVKKKAEQIALETKRCDLILVGHSMGGLVSSWYATKLAPPDSVTDVITIGSPLDGTPMARIALGSSAREMQRDSGLIKEMQLAIAKNQQIHFYHIASKSDQLVLPGASAILDGSHPERQFMMEDVGHGGLLFSVRVSQKIAEWLSE
ncbi:MAG: alpha/beta fold hydrolase [Chlamydiota bacterium]